MTQAKKPAGGEQGFDQILERLRTVVDKLELGNLSLEDSLATFEEGIGLAKKGHTLLDGAENKVEVLVRGADGGDTTAPLPDPEER